MCLWKQWKTTKNESKKTQRARCTHPEKHMNGEIVEKAIGALLIAPFYRKPLTMLIGTIKG